MKNITDPTKRLYTLIVLVQDVPGVLSQVARLFSRKGYNIESIVTGGTEKPGVARLSISILADESMIEQIAAQCRKLYPVIAVKVINEDTALRRELVMVKLHADNRNTREEIIQLANIFRAQIIDVSHDTITVAVTGDAGKSTALVDLLKDYGIMEIAKTGTIAIERGRSTIYDDTKIKEEYDYGKNVL